MISLCLNNNKKHAVPPPRLSCPKVGKPEKNGMSHCTALLKNYCLGLFKDKKRDEICQKKFCKDVFPSKKCLRQSPNIMEEDLCHTVRYWTFVTLHNVYFVKYYVTVSFLAQVLNTVAYFVSHVLVVDTVTYFDIFR